jgi:hypothetical protein
VRRHAGGDHSYFFISSYMEDHVKFHAKALAAAAAAATVDVTVVGRCDPLPMCSIPRVLPEHVCIIFLLSPPDYLPVVNYSSFPPLTICQSCTSPHSSSDCLPIVYLVYPRAHRSSSP